MDSESVVISEIRVCLARLARLAVEFVSIFSPQLWPPVELALIAAGRWLIFRFPGLRARAARRQRLEK